jgi:hypothetical protein
MHGHAVVVSGPVNINMLEPGCARDDINYTSTDAQYGTGIIPMQVPVPEATATAEYERSARYCTVHEVRRSSGTNDSRDTPVIIVKDTVMPSYVLEYNVARVYSTAVVRTRLCTSFKRTYEVITLRAM